MTDATAENQCVLDLSGMTPPFKLDGLFAVSTQSVELEIGIGKGMFLRREAAARPETGFLGVERAAKWFGICARRLERDGHPNARIIRADAFDLLARWVPLSSLGAVHVLFPDPWPKKRHAKRRLLSPALYDLTARVLSPDGKFTVATDVGWYFDEAMEVLDQHHSFERLDITAADREWIQTNYAIKYEKQGRTLNLARFSRNESPSPPIPPPPSRRRRSASSDQTPDQEAS